MTTLRAGLRRRRLPALIALLAGIAALTYGLVAGAATPIPVPDLLVEVKTRSTSPAGAPVVKTHHVPIGGAPVPIDVDGPAVTGVLEPDIDVSVGLVAIEELPDKPVVPNVVVRRNALAVALDRPAPPLDIDAKIVLRDANNALEPLVEVHYGFSTPAGARIPPVVSAKLVGPVQGGFVDPLQAKLETPGYSGPLDFQISARTEDLDANFKLGFDAVPEAIFVSQDPREDGLDALYTHSAPVADVHLDASATLRNRLTNELLEVGAEIERLPQRIALSNTNTEETTHVTYDSSSALHKPDIEAVYRDRDADGDIVTDVSAKVAGLPFKMEATIGTAPTDDGGSELDSADFRVLDGEQIDAVDFVVRNYEGPSGPVPAPTLAPEQYVAVGQRFVDGTTRMRAAGRLLGIRSATFDLQGPRNDIVDATTDLGDGTVPLRAIVDIDDRPDPSVQDEDDKRLKVDTTLSPLPQNIHFRYEPSPSPAEPMRLLYESSRGMDVEAEAVIADGPADGCGQPQVTCAKARVDSVPTLLDVTLPGPEGTDFAITNNAGAGHQPDARAVVDITGEDPQDRTYAEVALLRLPNEMRGRLDSTDKGVLRKAEFHACAWNFDTRACAGDQGAIGRVDFTVRDRPSREDLPARPETGPQFVAMVSRDPTLPDNGDERFEASGSVREVRHVAFHQRDDADDGKPDGTIGVKVAVSVPDAPFDIALDTVGRAHEPDDETVDMGEAATRLDVHIPQLPSNIDACFRENATAAPPDPDDLDGDPLLEECDRRDVLRRSDGELDITPMSVHYKATGSMEVQARLDARAPDPKDRHEGVARSHTTVLDTTITDVPAEVRVDMIPGAAPDPTATPPGAGRKLELAYQARDLEGDPAWIEKVAVKQLESRRTSDVCGDPRPKRLATCMRATVHDLPSDIYASFDPDETRGDLEFSTSVPLPGRDRPSIDPFNLESVSPDSQAPLIAEATIKGLTPRLSGRVKSLELDPAPGRELAELRLNACIDDEGDERCSGAAPFGHGVESIDFEVSNAFIGEGLPDIPVPASDEDWVGFVARSNRHRAEGKISALREVLVSRLDPGDDSKVLKSTRIRAGFGPDAADASVSAFADIADAGGRKLMNIVLAQPPKAFDVCLRDPVDTAEVAPGSPVWCERMDAARRAIRVGVELPGSGRKPDIDVKRLLIENATGTEVLTGNAQIANLGRYIDVLAAGDPREEGHDAGSCGDDVDNDGDTQKDASDPDCRPGLPDVLIEGRDEDGQVANIAGRITAKIQNFKNGENGPVGPPQGAADFPWKPYENRTAPKDDPRNADAPSGDDPGGTNYVSAVADVDGRFLLDASVPDVRRIGVRPGPCYTDDRVRKASEFPLQFQPQYTCARVHAAPGSPLGISFRTLKDPEVPPAPGAPADSRIMAIEEGHISQMPTGDKGFEATIAALPKTLEEAELCGSGETAPCRPPLISVETDRGAGQSADDVTLEAGVAMGPMSLLGKLGAAEGLDDASRRLNYEEPTKDWPAAAKGARLKIGTLADDSAVRLRVKLGLPRFLDFYPPQTWSCKSRDRQATEPHECSDTSVSADNNEGFASTDIFLKLVGADTKHDGVGHRYLGRVSALFQPFSGDGDQIVLTGAPEPDGKDIFNEPVAGASSTSPDTVNALPTGDPSFYGARLPGHLDVRIQMRNDFTATKDLTALGIGDFKNQQLFTQIDGRINRPMTMQMRLNDKLMDAKSGHKVSAMSLTAANLAGTNDQDAFDEPSFRVRAELTPSYSGGTWLDDLKIIPAVKAVMALIEFLDKTKDFSPVYVSPVFPEHTEVGWLDIKLNADPTTPDNELTSSEAARTVDAVAGPFGALNQAELRGWKSIHGFGDDDFNRNDGARITPQAALHLYNFDLGAEVGVSLYGLAAVGIQLTDVLDMVMGVSGDATKRVKLEQVLSSLALYGDGEGGDAIIDVDATAQLGIRFTVSLLWGLIDIDFPQVRIGSLPQEVGYLDCSQLGGPMGRATSSQIDEAALLLGFPDWNQVEGVDDAAAGTIATAVAVVTQLISPISCLLHAFYDGNDNLITGRHPAPRYAVNGHPIEGTEEADDPPPAQTDPGVTNPATTPPQDITIANGETAVYCGVLVVGNLVVESGGQLLVGQEGQADPHNPGKTCDGSLQIGATNVTVHGGGVINASARRTSLIPVPGGGETRGEGGGDGGDRSDIGGFGGGSGGGVRDVDEQPPIMDFGAPGENGGNHGGGGAGGRGGGALIISANENITIHGHVRANGEAGGSHPDYPSSCLAEGGGGGAGGGIEMSALRVRGSGEITANGGRGGDSSESGGGGAGGHITINTITDSAPDTTADGGDEGDADHADGDCNDEGDSGDDGDDDEGEVFHAAGFVTLHPDTPGPVQGSDQVKLNVRAIQDGGGSAYVVVCRRSGPPELEGGLQSPELDPPEDASAFEAISAAADCHVREFDDPTHGSDEYRATMTVPAPNGWHGYYAIVDVFQDVAPSHSSALIGVDRSGPYIESDPPFEGNGVAGCPDGTTCLNVPTAVLSATLKDPMSGVFATRCRVDGGDWNSNCSTGKTHTVAVDPDKQGVHGIDMEMADRVGNTSINKLEDGTTRNPLARFFVDTKPPAKPALDVVYSDGAGVNGWHDAAPTVTASTSDVNPSGGFADDPLTVYVSGDDNPCGDAAAGSTSTSGTIGASCAASEIDVPQAGIHEVVARAVDRAGNVSAQSDKVEIRIDKDPPTSQISLTPRQPDGKNGWYRTPPLFTFAAEDNPDGSGIDLSKAPSRIEYQIDGGDWEVYDPESEENYIPEGEHDICWKAWDVAGNEQTTTPCLTDIRVDTTAPTAADGLSPAVPTGDNSFYLDNPTVSPSATNPLPEDVNVRSPLDKVEMQIDGGDWTTAAPTGIPEGEHEVRTRAFDEAGNPSAITQRRIYVDKSDPSARLVSFPPQPNDRGWFRSVVSDSIATSDGRDGSGTSAAQFSVDSEGPASYLGPFEVPHGVHDVDVRARDLAGRQGSLTTATQKVDLRPPYGAPVGRAANILIQALGIPTSTTLKFTATDQLPGDVKVRVHVYNALGHLVRRLDAGPYRAQGSGQVVWNGRDARNRGVAPGLYHYRVHVTDEAGNTVLSDESPTFVVLLGLLPL